MKLMISFVVLSLVMAACTLQDNTGNVIDDSMVEGDSNPIGSEDHIGCQENEISIGGQCVVAENSNADLFDQDLEASVVTEDIDSPFRGYIARPVEEGNYPGIIMIHEWWGLNDNIKEMARILADQGYVVIAVDLYEGQVATDSAAAGSLASNVRDNPEEAISKMKLAVDYLKNEEGITSIGSLGWCFGGGQSLQLSLNEDIDATVIYYGAVTNDASELARLDGKVLGIFGSEDTSIPVEDVRSFESSLNNIGVDNQVYIYEGVGHAFANPSGSNYAKTQTLDAWQKTVEFLNSTLKEDSVVMGEGSMAESTGAERRIMIDSMNYVFLIGGEQNPDIIVDKGDRVIIDFTSSQGTHNFYIDELGVSSQTVRAGETTTIEFIASETGTFEYYCSVGEHRVLGMEGNIIVN